MLIGSCVGGMAELLAPGNYVRADSALYTDFYAQNIIFRTIKKYSKNFKCLHRQRKCRNDFVDLCNDSYNFI